MSKRVSVAVPFICSMGCDGGPMGGGCPGHRMQITEHYTSDTVEISIDGQSEWQDAAWLEALERCLRSLD